jgi:putative peptide zinc metalloprotease protein
VQLLAIVGQRNALQVSNLANSLFMTETTEEEVIELVEFLRFNNLVKADSVQMQLYQQHLETNGLQNWKTLAMRNPMFFRVPIWNPDRFLELTLPYVRWLGSKPALYLFVFITLLGFYLLSRQFDEFMSTFLHFFSWSGAVLYGATLLGVKILHELGHAYTAKAAGCRVPLIGVAMLVGWPVLYTDTSDAWQIPRRRSRLAIGAAGVSVELAVASISLFLWSISPEGMLKSAFFVLATTTWVLSVAVNFNPLMRFDGYYLLSDLIEEPNLERRAFAVGKWWLRERIFGFGMEPPEPFKKRYLVFSFAVWTYRFFLFLGIALLVYSFVFKAAGLVLFVVQMSIFIGKPVATELMVWWSLRDKVRLNMQTIRTLGILLLAMIILFVPWFTAIEAPGVLQQKYADVYVPESGQLQEMSTPNTPVNSGDVVFQLVSPELDHELQLVQDRYRELSRSQASVGFNAELRSQATVIASELRTQNQRLRSLTDKKAMLNIVAPFSGVVVDIAADIRNGDWLPRGLRLATILDPNERVIIAYLQEEDLSRVSEGVAGRFFPENVEFGVKDVVIRTIDFGGSTELDKLYLASLFGGDIAVRENDSGGLTMIRSYYRIELELQDERNAPHVVRGTVIIDGQRTSLFSQMRRRFVSVFFRETGF